MSDVPQEPAAPTKKQRRLTWRKLFLFAFLLVMLPYLILETIVTTVCWTYLDWPPPQASQFHEAIAGAPLCSFDPISGYRIGPKPARWLVVNPDGTVQSWGEYRGNNLGFPDADDFQPKRKRPDVLRFAVLGDSMTASQFIRRNWPAFAEDHAAKLKRPIELLNFAVDGGGVANWWGIVEKLIGPNDYELDGVIFAVCCDDLYRGFYFVYDDYRNGEHSMKFGRVPGMNPNGFPTTLESASKFSPFLANLSTLPPDEIDRLIEKKTTRPAERGLPVIMTVALMTSLFRNFTPQGKAEGTVPFDKDLQTLILDLKRTLVDKMKLPVLVVTVPMPDASPIRNISRGVGADVAAFARLLNARVLEGSQAFEGLSAQQISDSFLKYEYHWNEVGAQRFGDFMADKLQNWPNVGSPPPAASPTDDPANHPKH